MPMGMLQAFIDSNLHRTSEEELKKNFHEIGHMMLSWVHPEEYESDRVEPVHADNGNMEQVQSEIANV